MYIQANKDTKLGNIWNTYYIVVGPVISKSVFRYRKVPFYPTNIDNVSFYEKFIDIDIDAQYQEIYTDIFSILQYRF